MRQREWTRARWGLLVALLAAATSAGAPARAADSPDQVAARDAWKRGNRAFEAGQYQDALAAFEQGYQLSKRPRFLLNMAHAHRKMGQAQEALSLYKRFLLTEPKEDDRVLAEQMVAEVEAFIREDEQRKAAQAGPAPAPPAFVPPPADELHLRAGSEALRAPVYKRWYFWAGVGAVVVAGVATALVLSSGSDRTYQQTGTWGVVRL